MKKKRHSVSKLTSSGCSAWKWTAPPPQDDQTPRFQTHDSCHPCPLQSQHFQLCPPDGTLHAASFRPPCSQADEKKKIDIELNIKNCKNDARVLVFPNSRILKGMQK